MSIIASLLFWRCEQWQYSFDKETYLPIPFSEKERHFVKEKSTFSEKQKKDLGILTTVTNSDWRSQASGGNSASHRPGNLVTAVYANYTFGCHVKHRTKACQDEEN